MTHQAQVEESKTGAYCEDDEENHNPPYK